MTDFVGILQEIENRLSEEIDVNELAKKVCMSVYEFRRIFSFVVGVPISEYIRKRRLSTAAEDILASGISVTEAAMKYQYDDPSSFTRAFKEFHGVAPSELSKNHTPLKMYTKVDFRLQVDGGNSVEYRLCREEDYYIEGVKGFSRLEEKECCEEVWSQFEASPRHDDIVSGSDGYVYASYENGKDGVLCHVGRRVSAPSNEGLDYVKIPAGTYAVFTLYRTDDEYVNGYYGGVIAKWLSSGIYRRNEALPNVEVFPADMSKDGFAWEIHVPIVKRR